MAGNSAVFVVALAARLMAAAVCPDDWIRFEHICLQVFEGPANWDEAKKQCENRGAHLASVHSKAENDQYIFACGNVRPYHQGCWLGGTDRNQPRRQWIWVDGTAFQWSRWFDHGGGNVEPNNDFCTDHRHCTYGHTADCNVLEVSKPFRGHWLDTFCTDRQKFICKVNDTSARSNDEDADAVPSTDRPPERLAPPPPPTPPPIASPSPLPPMPTPSWQSSEASRVDSDAANSNAETEKSLGPSRLEPTRADLPSTNSAPLEELVQTASQALQGAEDRETTEPPEQLAVTGEEEDLADEIYQ
ncbi:unnamed protein product [Durusdinium trenchii]|uniref:C-type lectin domain-containing protein n=1 Tax=Durusdinium trenchii TaxID=1381693 RepID=A0ABP0HDK0_9DINO